VPNAKTYPNLVQLRLSNAACEYVNWYRDMMSDPPLSFAATVRDLLEWCAKKDAYYQSQLVEAAHASGSPSEMGSGIPTVVNDSLNHAAR
jgi:hypothetical protein